MMNSPPVEISQRSDSHLPSRIFGPCRSSRIATRRSPSAAMDRTTVMRAACSCCVPCEALRRKMETPQAIIWRSTAGASVDGPSVTTILVFDMLAGYYDHSDIMPIIQVIVLAVIQGITEFLPVSSTAHLIVAPWLLGWPDPGLTFDVALHVGTLVAVAAYFFRIWLKIILH